MTRWQLIILTPLLAFGLAMAGMVVYLWVRALFKNRRHLRLACDIAGILVFLSGLFVVGKVLEAIFRSPPDVPAYNIWMINAGLYLQMFILLFAMHFAWRKRWRIARFMRRRFGKLGKSLG